MAHQLKTTFPSLPCTWNQSLNNKWPIHRDFPGSLVVKTVLSLQRGQVQSGSRSVQLLSRVPMDFSMSGFPAHHQLLELAQTHVHRVSDARMFSQGTNIQERRPIHLLIPCHIIPSLT